MRWGVILAVAGALACAGTAGAQIPESLRCGWAAVPWRLAVASPLEHRTCTKRVGLHGGWMRTVVRERGRTLVVLETGAWYPPPGGRQYGRNTPLPLVAKTQTFYRYGARFRLRVLEQSPRVRALVASLRFVD